MAKRGRPKKEEKKENKKEKKDAIIQIPKIDLGTMVINIYGLTPLIPDRVPEWAIEDIADKEAGKAKQGKRKIPPRKRFLASLHIIKGKHCFPAQAFYKSAIKACSSLKGVITQVQAKQSHRVIGDYVEIKGKKPKMRMDVVRPPGRINLKYRGEYAKWSVRLLVKYNKNVITPEQILNLYNTAGFAVGVGSKRPESGGSNGMFTVVGGK